MLPIEYILSHINNNNKNRKKKCFPISVIVLIINIIIIIKNNPWQQLKPLEFTKKYLKSLII